MQTEHSFKKSLGLLDSTAIVMGSMIGSGIFIVSADMARQLGSPGWLLVVWMVTGLLTIIAAVSYGELASMFPHAGGQYVYLREAYNPLFGFLYGWTLFLVIQTGTIAAVGMAFAKFFGVLVPWFSEKHILLDLGIIRINTVHIMAISSILLLTFLNTKGIKFGKIIQNSFTFTKVAAVIGFLLIGFFVVTSLDSIHLNKEVFWKAVDFTKKTPVTLTGFALLAVMGTAAVGSLFSADAWINITFAGAEVKNSKKNLALSLFIGTLIVSVIYVLANIVYLKVLPLRGDPNGATVLARGMQYAANDRLGTATISLVFGESAALIMALFIIISTFGCNNGLILAGARVYYTMANDRLFFKKVGRLNKNDVPGNGLLVQGIWASLLCLSGTYGQLLNYVVFAVLIFYVMTIIGIFILRYKRPDAERPYKAFGYPVLPVVYILIATFIMIDLLFFKTDNTWPGLIIVLLGIPIFYIWKTRGEKKLV